MPEFEVHTAIVVAVTEELRAVLRRTRNRQRTEANDVAIWTGTIAKRRVAVVPSGMGRAHAEHAADALLGVVRPHHALIMGFCGGISEWAGAADLVLAEYVMDWPDFPGQSDMDQPHRTLVPDACMHDIAKRVELPKVRVVEGGILSVGSLVRTTLVKGFHGPRASRCRALDMETGTLAAAFESAGVPWMAIRAVTDTLEEDLPLPFEEFLKADGDVSRLKVMGAAFAHPSLLLPLLRLARQSLRAAGNMALFAERLLAAM